MGRCVWANGSVAWAKVASAARRYYNLYHNISGIDEMSYERGSLMLAHSALIGAVIYLVMRYFFNQPALVAEDRSIAIAAIVLIYMVMFGHGMPKQLNRNLSFLS
jgi:hypothetical protein